MAYDAGKVLIMPKNEWDSNITYEILDSVTYQKKAYLSKKNNNTNEPSGVTDDNWFLYAKDGRDGIDGIGIISITKTSSQIIDGRTIDTYTITFTNESTQTFTIVNGKDGTGTGDMEKSVYDTNNNGKVDIAEKAEKISWDNVEEKPFSELGTTLQVINQVINTKAMTGATNQVDGSVGIVPKPVAGDDIKVLFGDGTWKEIDTMTGATELNAGIKGLVPVPSAGDNEKFLKGDGTWGVADSLGTVVTSTVNGKTVSFTDVNIIDTSIIDGVYVKDSLVGLNSYEFDAITHTLTFTFIDNSADGKTAIIYVRN